MRQLTSRVWYLPHTPESDRPTLGYVRGDRRALLLDAGNSPAHLNSFLSQLAAAGLPAPEAAVLTHRHWDHSFGACAFPGAVIAGRATQAYLRRYAALPAGEAGLQAYLDADGLRGFSEPHLRLEYPAPAAIRVRPADAAFDGTLELDLGGCLAAAKTTGAPHCGDCVFVHLPAEGVVFLGDAACKALVGGQWVDDPAGAAALLAALEPLDFSLALVGHDGPLSREALLEDLAQRSC